ncbi:uncharacterized protein LOC119083953 [Bradysia coprophila]|uniref:uncharacterized protein LOC119083953 n=1 Tax=Bradysia coprophila TaxID=38358 RepID=UPI00187D849B|nr:uncharacterized protein LOC119083953 [Bradysia coprophila]
MILKFGAILVIQLFFSNCLTYAYDDGSYHPDNRGQYIPDNSGRYISDNSGQYIPDNSGRYIPDNGGFYVRQPVSYELTYNPPSVRLIEPIRGFGGKGNFGGPQRPLPPGPKGPTKPNRPTIIDRRTLISYVG